MFIIKTGYDDAFAAVQAIVSFHAAKAVVDFHKANGTLLSVKQRIGFKGLNNSTVEEVSCSLS